MRQLGTTQVLKWGPYFGNPHHLDSFLSYAHSLLVSVGRSHSVIINSNTSASTLLLQCKKGVIGSDCLNTRIQGDLRQRLQGNFCPKNESNGWIRGRNWLGSMSPDPLTNITLTLEMLPEVTPDSDIPGKHAGSADSFLSTHSSLVQFASTSCHS